MEDEYTLFLKDYKQKMPQHLEVSQEQKKQYESFFRDTTQLKDNFKNLPIINGCRNIYKKNGQRGYDEVFLSQKHEYFGGISENISFIFPPDERIYDKRIGFRFYQKPPLKSNNDNIPYFTLLLKNYRRYEILEKHGKILDSNGKLFIITELNCLEIMDSIISSRFNSNIDKIKYPFPYSVVEILGFIYACKEKLINELIILEPYFPSPFIPDTLKEDYFEIKENNIYIEPILYDRHISILLFYFKIDEKNVYNRKNYLIDFSLYHYHSLIKYNPIFTEKMKMNLKNFPKEKMQFGPSCSIWFIGAMQFIMETKINEIVLNDKIIICKIIEKINKIMKINENLISLNPTNNNINQDENLSGQYFLSFKIALSPFINIDGIISKFRIKFFKYKDMLIKYQNQFYQARKIIDELKLNKKYYEIVSKTISIDENYYNSLLKEYNDAEKLFMEMMKLKLIISDIYCKLSEDKNYQKYIDAENKENLLNSNLDELINKNKVYQLYTLEDFHRIFVDNNDIYLQLFNN